MFSSRYFPICSSVRMAFSRSTCSRSISYRAGIAPGYAPKGAWTTASTRKYGTVVRIGSFRNSSVSTISSAETITRKEASAASRANRFVPKILALPNTSAGWTCRKATSGFKAGTMQTGSPVYGSGLHRPRLEPRRRLPARPPGRRVRQREDLRDEPVRPRGGAGLLPRDRLGRGDRRDRRVPEGSDADHGPVFPGRRGGPCPLRRVSRRDAGAVRDRSRTRRPAERHPHGRTDGELSRGKHLLGRRPRRVPRPPGRCEADAGTAPPLNNNRGLPLT